MRLQRLPATRLSGVVQVGRQLGRKLGFPTANVAVPAGFALAFGVYATRTGLEDGRTYPGVASIGVCPTVEVVAPRLEVWLFGFDEEIYGQTIETEFVHYLRGEVAFDSLTALTRQVMADAEHAKRLLGVTSPHQPAAPWHGTYGPCAGEEA
jgi:riboflavin kinase/FMN adenylyltransferase